MTSSLGSNVAHVRPIQIQPIEEDDDKSNEKTTSDNSTQKDPGFAFENIITIAPIEEETIYKTVTVNINGVTKDVKVPISRPQNDSTSQQKGTEPVTVTQTNTPSNISQKAHTVVVQPQTVTTRSVPIQQSSPSLAGRSLLASHIGSPVGGLSRNAAIATAGSQASILYVGGTSTVASSSISATQSGIHQTNKNSTFTILPSSSLNISQKAKAVTARTEKSILSNTNLASNLGLNLKGGTPGFLGSDGKFYIQLDATKLQPLGVADRAKQSVGSGKSLVKQNTVQVPGGVKSSGKQLIKSGGTTPTNNTSYVLKYMNTLKTFKPVQAVKQKTVVSKAPGSSSVSMPNENPLRIDSIFSLSGVSTYASTQSTQSMTYQVLRNTLNQTRTVSSGKSTPTVTSSTQPRKKFLGTIDISADEASLDTPKVTTPTTVSETKTVNSSSAESSLSIARKFGDTLVSIIGDITKESTKPGDLGDQPGETGDKVKYPRNTARKSFGRFKNKKSDQAPDSAYHDIKVRFPELRDLRVSVEKLDIGPKKQSIDINKLKAYMQSRRKYRKRKELENLKKEKRNRLRCKKEPKDEEYETKSTEKKSKFQSSKKSTNSNSDGTDPRTCANSEDKASTKHTETLTSVAGDLTTKSKRLKELKKKSPVTSSTSSSTNPLLLDSRSKFLLIKTSNANYLMPVQSDVSPLTVANQISKKTSANVTVVSSASVAPVVSSSVMQRSAVSTPSAHPVTIKSERISPGYGTGASHSKTSSTSLISPQTFEFLFSPSQPGLATTNTGRSLLSPSINISPSSPTQTPILASMKASLMPETSSKLGTTRVLTGSPKQSSSVGKPTVDIGKKSKRKRMYESDSDTDSADSSTDFPSEASLDRATQNKSPRVSQEVEMPEATSVPSSTEDKPTSSMDRIKQLRERLRQQEQALELARVQREKTNKVLMEMD